MPKPKRDDVILKAVLDLGTKIDATNSRLDRSNERLSGIETTVAKQEVNVAIHVKRSDQNEELVKLNKTELDAKLAALTLEVEPVKKHVAMVEGILKGFGLIAGCIAMVAGLVKIAQFVIQMLHH